MLSLKLFMLASLPILTSLLSLDHTDQDQSTLYRVYHVFNTALNLGTGKSEFLMLWILHVTSVK